MCIYRLTAFVLKSFAQSRGFIFIDPKELTAAKDWIIQHQKEDGSFPAMGRILNKDIQVKTIQTQHHAIVVFFRDLIKAGRDEVPLYEYWAMNICLASRVFSPVFI